MTELGRLGKLLQKLSAMGICLGVLALVLVMGVIDGFESRVAESISQVTSPLMIINQTRPQIPTNPVAELASAPGYLMMGLVTRGVSVGFVEVHGVAIDQEPAVSGLSKPPKLGSWPKSPGEIAIGTELAKKLGAPKVGDTINLILNGQGRLLQVTGIADFGMFQLSEKVVLVSHLELENQVGAMGALKLFPKDMFQTEAIVRSRVDYPLMVRSWRDLNGGLLDAIATERVILFVIMAFIVSMGALNLVSTILTQGQENAYRHSVLRALGWRPRQMLWSIMGQGIWATAPGVVIGLLLGMLVVWGLSTFPVIPIPGDVYGFASLPGKIRLPTMMIIWSFSTLLILLASFVPAYLLSKRPIMRGLR